MDSFETHWIAWFGAALPSNGDRFLFYTSLLLLLQRFNSWELLLKLEPLVSAWMANARSCPLYNPGNHLRS